MSSSINESSNSFCKKCFSSIRNKAAALAIDAGIQKKIHVSGTITLITSNKEINEILKSIKLLKILTFRWKESLKQLKLKQKRQKGQFLSMLLATLGAIC